MTKALATQHELKQKACSEVINSLVAIATADENKACHEGGCEDYVRKRDQGEGKASKDHCEGLPSVCLEEADLECCSNRFALMLFQRLACRGNPMDDQDSENIGGICHIVQLQVLYMRQQ